MASQEGFIETLGNQTFIIDPEFQGFGLQRIGSSYSNKFFILTNEEGAYISAHTIPEVLLDYYRRIGLAVAKREHIITLERSSSEPDKSLLERIADHEGAKSLLKNIAGSTLVPYMLTSKVEQFANRYSLQLLTSARAVQQMANKARLQEKLEARKLELANMTGFDLVIPSVIMQQGDEKALMQAYDHLNDRGRRSIVVTKPESASAFGIFVHKPDSGLKGLNAIVRNNFVEGEEILLRAFAQHNHSPSLQGGRLRGEAYKHLYIGRQLITYTTSDSGESVTYDSNQVPFNNKVVKIHADALVNLVSINQALGTLFIELEGIAGIAGFDTVVELDNEGHLQSVGVTELNLHLPGSSAAYAAICKLFPNGLDGIAHNFRLPFPAGLDIDTFMRNNKNTLVQKQESYGVFPINASYIDKVDIIIFAQDLNQLQAIRSSIVL